MKSTTRSAIIAVLAIVAVALAAATLNSTVIPEQSGPTGPGVIGDEGEGGFLPPPRSRPAPGPAFNIPFLAEAFLLAAIVAIGASILATIAYWREALQVALASLAVLGIFYLLFQLLASGDLTRDLPELAIGNGTFLGGGGGNADATQPTPPSVLLLVILGVAVVGTVLALFQSRGGVLEDSPQDEDEDPSAAAVGRAAGRAADRLEGVTSVDNEVYRAWREMTELLDVEEPDSTTPGEFATAAVAAGLGRADVDELTRLFEDVRYGSTEPSEDLEARALAVFRRIESRYADQQETDGEEADAGSGEAPEAGKGTEQETGTGTESGDDRS